MRFFTPLNVLISTQATAAVDRDFRKSNVAAGSAAPDGSLTPFYPWTKGSFDPGDGVQDRGCDLRKREYLDKDTGKCSTCLTPNLFRVYFGNMAKYPIARCTDIKPYDWEIRRKLQRWKKRRDCQGCKRRWIINSMV